MKENICSDCVKQKHLKLLINNKNTENVCDFCGNNTNVCDINNEFYDLLKSLIRYYYNEWDYNHHWGGDELYRLLENEDIFFNKENFTNPEDIEFLIELVDTFEAYEDYTKGISLYAGYTDGNQNTLLRSIKDEIDISLKKIIFKLKTENYFNLEDEIIEKLKLFIPNINLKIKKNTKYYRARIGYSKKEFDNLSFDMEGKYIYIPYSKNEIGSPPLHLAQSGRLNRVGVSYLYSATNLKTAISEVRPHPGDKVSIGTFENNVELKIFNLAKDYLMDFYGTDEKLDNFVFINSLNILFQKTIPPSKRDNYSITQLVSDSIRKLGFDGILYNSSVEDGKNLVVFEPKKMEYIEDGKNIFIVNKVSYEYKDIN